MWMEFRLRSVCGMPCLQFAWCSASSQLKRRSMKRISISNVRIMQRDKIAIVARRTSSGAEKSTICDVIEASRTRDRSHQRVWEVTRKAWAGSCDLTPTVSSAGWLPASRGYAYVTSHIMTTNVKLYDGNDVPWRHGQQNCVSSNRHAICGFLMIVNAYIHTCIYE